MTPDQLSPAKTRLRSQLLQQAQEVRRVTLWGMVINLLLAVVKFFVGLLATSQALIADAVHSLSDLSTDIAVLIGSQYWNAPADADHPHGHGRIETLVSFFIGAVLALVGIGLAYRAFSTLLMRHEASPGWSAFGAACFSVILKEILYRWTAETGKKVKSSALIANAWHHRSDAFSSIPVAVAVLGSKIEPSWGILDHIATIIVSVFILQAAYSITWPALSQLLDAGADLSQRQSITAAALATEGVREVHGLRTRHIGPGLQVDIHVQVDPALSVREGHSIAGRVKEKLLREQPDVVDVLIHIEPFENCQSEDQILFGD